MATFQNGHTSAIGVAWECTAPFERGQLKQFADASASMTPYVLGIIVDAQWLAEYGSEWTWRLPAFKTAYNIQEDNIVIGEDEFIIYRANRLWMTRLYTELIVGTCAVSDPYPCPRINFGDPPEIIE